MTRERIKIELMPLDQARLQAWVRNRNTPQKVVLRARMILMSAAGVPTGEIVAALGTNRPALGRWRRRFRESGVAGLERDKARAGRRPGLTAEQIGTVVHMTLHERPPQATQWSTRSMALASGVSRESVRRIWKAHGLKPHRVRRFKLSRDPQFAEKLRDVVGLYLHPPEKAVVLAVDEKSQIQALDRTQPGLPMKPGRAGTLTHDYKRNGTTTLFAALNVLEGRVIGQCMLRHRHQEFLRFLKTLDRQMPHGLALHLVLDNYATHKHPKVRQWLAKHSRFILHFTPTSASWANLVERFFAAITTKRLRRGSFRSVHELETAIHDYLAHHNQNPKPFVWTASAASILGKVQRGNDVLESLH